MSDRQQFKFKTKMKEETTSTDSSYLVCGSFQLLINGIGTCVRCAPFNRYKIACVCIDHSLIWNDRVKREREREKLDSLTYITGQ